MKTFWIRFVCSMTIVIMMFGYNMAIDAREKQDQIAKLYVDLESAANEITYQKNVLAMQTTLEEKVTEQEENNSLYLDGKYTGEAQGFGGSISVEVTIAEGEIVEINILSAANEDGAYLTMAKDIIPAIISEQSAQVDTISGATFSSTGIREAVKQALNKGMKS